MPNPTVEKLHEGVRIARENKTDLLLAVGGGSCCDYAKAVSVSVNCDEEPWDKYYIRFEEPTCEIVPVGCVLTMVGTGSEMMQPMAIVTEGGLIYGTLLTLFVVPCIYDAFNREKNMVEEEL